ncbi:hypothetical protein [Deinococcus yavapaiensis]|uniref:Uncharacterized protein n=1 Tax=Deinococcus yavapaiensis KR-236 TaxID=694435 RepID=A0A318SL42_9DEIO|nr:hypothetical protein [Deinococcus yavapaiensis]PYE55229.1 hypothetical protein DES52_10359 [Deinococcus yavapaiensis KR-236]
MATSVPARRGASASRVFLWLVLVALLALGTLLTGLAIRNNPLESDAAQGGVSKWLFLQQCQEKLAEQLPKGFTLVFAPPVERVNGTRLQTGGGWVHESVITVRGPDGDARARYQCLYDKTKKATEITGLAPITQ